MSPQLTALGLSCVALVSAPSPVSAQGDPGPAPAADAWAWHNGVTVEGSIGLGVDVQTGDDSETDRLLPSLCAGVGGFLAPRVALSLRMATSTVATDGLAMTIATVGPHVQYWVSPHVWLGAGGGLAFTQFLFGTQVSDGGIASPTAGFGLDVRAGFTFLQRPRSSLNVQIEVTPSYLDGGWATGVTIDLGFQLL